MHKWLLAVFIVVPIIEIWGMFQVGSWIGGWNTFFILIIMGLAGAYLARAEGRKVWGEAQRQMQAGQIPGQSLLDGLCVLAGGILLLMPGFLSDIIGITLLIPITRSFYRQVMLNWIEKRIKNGNFRIGRF
ncbi:membrane protein FxsA [Paenibacillus sp. FSL H8-0548]|uniref:FxsA family protein n=1 Tax=Paenibacillus sp. FSL H8-0548 TaxID=1920422 RepID=UPI00096C9786|nr:FxsA family protein [Paenibacillus sp. FSL H8-0548]OMF35897.1 membrane protein FxsA [Paenibacillus sp. FSL H8-0548]